MNTYKHLYSDFYKEKFPVLQTKKTEFEIINRKCNELNEIKKKCDIQLFKSYDKISVDYYNREINYEKNNSDANFKNLRNAETQFNDITGQIENFQFHFSVYLPSWVGHRGFESFDFGRFEI